MRFLLRIVNRHTVKEGATQGKAGYFSLRQIHVKNGPAELANQMTSTRKLFYHSEVQLCPLFSDYRPLRSDCLLLLIGGAREVIDGAV